LVLNLTDLVQRSFRSLLMTKLLCGHASSKRLGSQPIESIRPSWLDKRTLSKWYGMVFTSNELQKGRVSDYEIGPDRCNPTKVTGQFPTYIIAFDCKPGDNAPYTTNEQTNYGLR
jgi:hypothetical protein